MKKSLLWCLLTILPLALHSQVFIYGHVKSDRFDSIIYDTIEETLMDTFFEHGFICFNTRDINSFQLETTLYTAKSTGSKYIIIWRFTSDENLELMLYNTAGVEYKDVYQKINTTTLHTSSSIKTISARYASAIRNILPQMLNTLQKDSLL